MNLNEIYENIKTIPRTKTLWFDTPKEAIKYLKENIIYKVNLNVVAIRDESDSEITTSQALDVIDEYLISKDKLYFALEDGITTIEIYLEHWELCSDSDTYADVLTITK